MGRGGGWYDHALEYRAAGARVVAVCWPWEPTDKPVPHEDHDIPVDGVLTRTDLRPYANKTSEDKTFTQPSQGTY
ncbi:MAG: 5-formyltetrahydrofolate cyclo-ligase [Bifidobacterium sp.]